MLMEVKNQIKVIFLSFKYNLIKEMTNKVTFITNILFMILNNASFIVQWIILYSIKSNIAGYDIKKVLLLWAIASSTYGFSHLFFEKSYDLSKIINEGKLDALIVQPKNILLQTITSTIKTSAIGDIIYGYVILIIYGITIKNFMLFTFISIYGGIILTSIAIILGSLSFWFSNSETIAEIGNSSMTNFATYPDGIFKGITKIILYTLIPVGLVNYIPINLFDNFSINIFILLILICILFVYISYFIFNKGLKKYSSTNLMIVRY